MSYDLVVWRGRRPGDVEEAASLHEAYMQVVERAEAPPTAAIESFLDELTAQVTQVPEARSGDPWASSPWDDAVGDVVVLSLRLGRADSLVADCGRIAAAHGLICYDPQAGTLVR